MTITWRWDHNRMRWWTILDGVELVVQLQRFGKRTFWNPSINGKMLRDNGFNNPTMGQDAALAAWKKQKARRRLR